MNRTRQRGFTLIELMIALLVSSLLVGMILAIFTRMSLAYRSQQQIAGVQRILAAARAAIELDAKQAGLGMPQGFKTAMTGTDLQSTIQVFNSSTAPDQVALFYADTSIQALVRSTTMPTIGVDSVTGFDQGMLVVLTTASTAANPLGGDDIATYDACVLKLAAIDPAGTVTFDTTAPWGTSFAHCTTVIAGRTMMYRFVAHAYRIDPTPERLQFGALQQSETGGLLTGLNAEVWKDLAYGFSDLQTALRIYDPGGVVDLDGDTDKQRNWYSSTNQEDATKPSSTRSPSDAILLGMSISLVAHTDRSVEGIATLATPNLVGPPTADNNSLGDRPSTVLAVATPGPPPIPPWPDPLLPGQRIYRYTTFQVDFRNLGVGVGQ